MLAYTMHIYIMQGLQPIIQSVLVIICSDIFVGKMTSENKQDTI